MENKILIDAKKLDDFLQDRKETLRALMPTENSYQKTLLRGHIREIDAIQIELLEKFGLKKWFKTK